MAVTPPALTTLPSPPLPSDAEAVFDAKAGTFLTAQVAMVVEINSALSWTAAQVNAAEGYKNAAGVSASAAAGSATTAATQVGLAADQVGLAAQQVNLAGQARQGAESAASAAQTYAAAAQAAAGIPSMTGNAGKVLTVNSAGTAAGWQDGLPSLTGKGGYTLQVNAAATSPIWVSLGTMHVVDEKTSGTPGGNGSAVYAARTLNTVRINNIVGASLAGSQVTLPAGTYVLSGRTPSVQAGQHKCRIYNVSTSSVIALGSSEISTTNIGTNSVARALVTFSSTTIIRLEHRQGNPTTSVDLGSNVAFGDSEVYSELLIQKVS